MKTARKVTIIFLNAILIISFINIPVVFSGDEIGGVLGWMLDLSDHSRWLTFLPGITGIGLCVYSALQQQNKRAPKLNLWGLSLIWIAAVMIYPHYFKIGNFGMYEPKTYFVMASFGVLIVYLIRYIKLNRKNTEI